MGVNATGGILVRDPNPRLARPAVEDYLTGFPLPPGTAQATIAAAIRLEPQSAATPGFLLSALNLTFDVTGLNGRCGQTLSWAASSFNGADLPSQTPSNLALRACDGLESAYQLDANSPAERALILTDLGSPAGRQGIGVNGAASYRLSRPATGWEAGPLTVLFTSSSVVNAASFKAELSPGTLASAFGSGLGSPAGETTVEVAGLPAHVLAALPFQLNFVIPNELAPGSHPITIRSPYGATTQTVQVSAVSPAIFLLGGSRPAAVNQNGTLNSAEAPASRGQVLVLYATGLGATQRRGNLDHVLAAVEATLEGRPLIVQYAGLAPGYPGLYQVNLMIPAEAPPGLAQELRLRVAESSAAPVDVAVQ